MILDTIATIARFIEICALTVNGHNQILIVQQLDGMRQNPPRIETLWQLWTPGTGHAAPSVTWEASCFIPAPVRRISATVHANSLIAVIESNGRTASYMIELPLAQLPDAAATEPEIMVLDITQPAQLPLEKSWPTHTGVVAPEKSLFDPCALIARDGGTIAVATSADATLRIFAAIPGKAPAEKSRSALYGRPVIADIDNQRVIIAQRVNDAWSPFRYSTYDKIPSLLFPLHVLYLDAAMKVIETRDISTGEIAGPSFIFSACAADKNRLVIATVGNTASKPVLQTLVATRSARQWRTAGSIELSKMPRRIAVAAHGDEALIGLTFDLEEIKAVQFSID